jgi:hypothetical protein
VSDTPIPVDGSFESNAVDKLVQTAWDRFAALGHSDSVEDEQSDETRDLSASDDDEQEGDI